MLPTRSDWELPAEPVPKPGPGGLVVAVECLSIDPIIRHWVGPAGPVAVGDVMEAGVIGRVTSSEHPGFVVGEHLYGGFGVQEFASSDGTGVTKLDPLLAAPPTYLATLGFQA